MDGVCSGCADVANDPLHPLCPTALLPEQLGGRPDSEIETDFRYFQCSECDTRWLYYTRRGSWRRVHSVNAPSDAEPSP
jgi:hypothetical protein